MKWQRGLRWGGGVGLAVALVGVLALVMRARRAKDLMDPERARRQGRPIPVRTADVTYDAVEQVIGATAITTPAETAQVGIGPSRGLALGNPVSHIVIKAVHVKEGDQVQPGQVLFELDNEVFALVVKQKQAILDAARAGLAYSEEQAANNKLTRELELANARANLKFRTDDLENKEKTFEIYTKLYPKKMASTPQYYEARSNLALAVLSLGEAKRRLKLAQDSLRVGLLRDQAAVAQARGAVATAGVDRESALRDVGRTQIRSPIGGIADQVEVVAGQTVPVTNVLARIHRLDTIHVRLDFPQERVDEVAVGQQAEVTLDSFPHETFAGKVTRISPLVRPQLRVFPVVVEVPNPKNRIKAGISGFVRLRLRRKATAVPAAAVVRQGEQAVVFCVVQGRARLRPVRVGQTLANGLLEVRGGLAAGDRVVIFQNFYSHADNLAAGKGYLRDNDPVDENWRRWARRE
jgi:multidrug efflux pump subunit AcrA (membrane-fusion protein)